MSSAAFTKPTALQTSSTSQAYHTSDFAHLTSLPHLRPCRPHKPTAPQTLPTSQAYRTSDLAHLTSITETAAVQCCSKCSSKSRITEEHGASSPISGHEPVVGYQYCLRWMASTMPDLPSHGASLTLGWYQIILLGNRGTCVNDVSGSLRESVMAYSRTCVVLVLLELQNSCE